MITKDLEEFSFLVGMDHTVRLRVSHTSQDITFLKVMILKKRTITLVNLTFLDLTGAGGTGTGSARVRQVNSSFFSCIQYVLVVWDLKLVCLAIGSDELDLVHC